MRYARFLLLGLLALGALVLGPKPAQAQAPSTIDQISIDMDHTDIGVPGVGDRDGDGLTDSEGAATYGCGNAYDDDLDGTIDDGCVVTLGAREVCAEIDEAAWSALYLTRSYPFDPPGTGKIAIKVIDHYGDEVLKVYEV